MLQSELRAELGWDSSRCQGVCRREPGTCPGGGVGMGRGHHLSSLLIHLPLPRTRFLNFDTRPGADALS